VAPGSRQSKEGKHLGSTVHELVAQRYALGHEDLNGHEQQRQGSRLAILAEKGIRKARAGPESETGGKRHDSGP
jgi:hypothetical protein